MVLTGTHPCGGTWEWLKGVQNKIGLSWISSNCLINCVTRPMFKKSNNGAYDTEGWGPMILEDTFETTDYWDNNSLFLSERR